MERLVLLGSSEELGAKTKQKPEGEFESGENMTSLTRIRNFEKPQKTDNESDYNKR